MKLFHTENGKEMVYVQMQDIMYLINDTEIPIPADIMVDVFKEVTIVDDSNRFEFVKFEQEAVIKFFKELEFIIDYDKYKDLTDEQLEEEAQKLVQRVNEIVQKWNSMNKKQRQKNASLYGEQENLRYMLDFLSEIYAVRHGKRKMIFPEFVNESK